MNIIDKEIKKVKLQLLAEGYLSSLNIKRYSSLDNLILVAGIVKDSNKHFSFYTVYPRADIEHIKRTIDEY